MFPLLRYEVVSMSVVPLEDLRYSPEGHRPMVLVVHDDRMVAETLARILSRAGFATLTAYDGKSALELAMVVPPDLLISDVAIRGMNGAELAKAVVGMWPECRVLLFSSHETSATVEAACAAGYDFLSLTKPVHPMDVLNRVSGIQRWPGLRFSNGASIADGVMLVDG
jgi:DNA-binding response OmpR family regulator